MLALVLELELELEHFVKFQRMPARVQLLAALCLFVEAYPPMKLAQTVLVFVLRSAD